uniref:Uncharacterized protein n=1 Tax=Oryza sativa subsp. japonica TaxID=39947 RepID=Q338L6_ORYSJ|nr:hypothetical protein LOC_Os10g25690 [Oryza sativa Japonica Group]
MELLLSAHCNPKVQQICSREDSICTYLLIIVEVWSGPLVPWFFTPHINEVFHVNHRVPLAASSPELCQKSAGDPSDSHLEPPPEQASAPHQVIKDFRGGEQDEAAQMVFYIFTIVVPLSLLNPHQPTAWLVSAV